MPTHEYRVEGERVPGVTTILNMWGGGKQGVLWWANQQGLDGLTLQEARETVTNIGTIAHAFLERDILRPFDIQKDIPGHVRGAYKSLDKEDKERVVRCRQNARKWLKQHEVHPRAVEEPMVSKEHRYGGTPDFIGTIDGTPAILDLKTSKNLYPNYVAQIAAYRQLWLENEGETLEEAHILRVSKESASFHQHVFNGDKLEDFWEMFLWCRKAYRMEKRLKKML